MSHTTTSPAPPMKDMLKDMYEMVDSVLDNQGIGHAESLETMGKRSNAKFLQLNICLMMRAFQSVIAEIDPDTPCKECHEEGLALLKQATTDIEEQLEMIKELKEENVKLKEHLKDSKEWRDKAAKEMTRLKEENEKLKERQSIMSAMADSHIQDINEVHKDYGDMVRKIKEENDKLKEEIVKLNRLLETAVNCCDCGESESHKKTKWTYCTEDTDTNISRISPVWCCDQCLDKDD